MKRKIFSSLRQKALAGVVVVNSEVVGWAPGLVDYDLLTVRVESTSQRWKNIF
jgi:hypothetical protein